MKTSTTIYSILLLGAVTAPINAWAEPFSKNYSIALGIGNRPLDGLEAGIEKYIIDQGYNEIFPEITNAVNLKDYSMIYFTCELSFSPDLHIRKKDRLDFIFAMDATGFSKKGKEDLSPTYMLDNGFEVDVGNYKTKWEVDSPLYFSVGPGIAYAPITFQKGRFHVSPGFAVLGGVGYVTESSIDVTSKYETNELMDFLVLIFGEDIIDDFGIVREEEVHITMKGKGPFIHPKGRIPFGYDQFSFVVQGGPRFERINMSVVEQVDSERTTGSTQFNLNGFAGEILVRYDF